MLLKNCFTYRVRQIGVINFRMMLLLLLLILYLWMHSGVFIRDNESSSLIRFGVFTFVVWRRNSIYLLDTYRCPALAQK